MEKCDDTGVLRDAVIVITAIRRHLEFYAGDFAPARTDQISTLLSRSGCALEVFPFPLGADEKPIDPAFVLPLVGGINVICIDQNASRTDRQYAIRHELTHVFREEVTEPTYLTSTDSMSASERCADLVAFADIVPGWWIRMLRAAGEPWKTIRTDIQQYVIDYSEGRPRAWVADRASLRLRLFRECGI